MELENSLPAAIETFRPFAEPPSPPYASFSKPPTPPFDAFSENPITPELKGNDGTRTELRRESNFSIQSDDIPMKCFRTPSVVVSDHSEDTGSVALDEIRRIHVLHRRSRRYRRHSDIVVESPTSRLFSDSENVTDSSTNSDATEYFLGSNNASPVPRRKQRVCRATRKAVSLDETAIMKRNEIERKCSQFSEVNSNDLSPISSRKSSLYSDDSSRRSSVFSDISPVLHRRSYQSWRKASDTTSRSSMSPVFGVNLMDEFRDLECRRSLSFEDIYGSDLSYSDLSSDCSASSSLSNLPGTLYYYNYNPKNLGTSQHSFRPNGNIKPSKSCSDFLSVSRILEDYPYLRHRRHSNGQVASDVTEFRQNAKPSVQKRTRVDSFGNIDNVEINKSSNSVDCAEGNGLLPDEATNEPEMCRKVSERLNAIAGNKELLLVDGLDLLHGSLSRKPSDCSTCSTTSGEHDILDTLPTLNPKSKVILILIPQEDSDFYTTTIELHFSRLNLARAKTAHVHEKEI